MKRFAWMLAAFLCLLAVSGFAEMVETLPVPENCQAKEYHTDQNSVFHLYMDYGDLPDPFRGWVGEKTAMFMEDTPEGRVFAGYVRQEEGRWLRTVSTPLPEGAVCQPYITKEELFYFSYPVPQEPDSETGSPQWMLVAIGLESDGAWRFLGGRIHHRDYFFAYEADCLLVNLEGWAYGTCTFDRDVRTMDWAAITLTWADAVNFLSPDMGVIGTEALPLYADAACTALLAEYRPGTPVTVLEQECSLARVRIWDSAVTGWLEADGLLLGSEQLLVTGTYEDADGVHPRFDLAASLAPGCLTGPGATLCDAPDGTPIRVTDNEYMLLLADLGNGWYHVGMDPFYRSNNSLDGTPMSCYIRAEEMKTGPDDSGE